MERTESTVVQVSPDYENSKIKEMEMFGWNLQGRQEIHEKGEAYGRPSYLSNSTYVVKTTVKHYVKLHFIRSLSLPNLDKIKQIESEYFSLQFPTPPSLTWPVIIFGMGILSLFGGLINIRSGGLMLILGSILYLAVGGFWLNSRIKKRKVAMEKCAQSARRMNELKSQLQALLI